MDTNLKTAPPRETSWVVDLPDLAATAALAHELGGSLRPDDLVTLSGELGSGKTSFARALLRSLTGEADFEVPSPTFSLMQVYDTPAFRVVHADLYRVNQASELAELGWDEAADGAVVLVEWAERAGPALAPDRLDIAFIIEPEEGPEHRVCVLTGFGAWSARVGLLKALDRLLGDAGWRGAKRVHVTGDASFRAYERLEQGGRTALLMISPPRPDGPPVRLGKPYSAIARLAENVTPFVAMANALRARGFSAPEIYAQDLRAGLLLIEDFGDGGVVDEEGPIAERYLEAAALLARLHAGATPDVVRVTENIEYTIPPYDLDALGVEVELLTDWYLPLQARRTVPSGAKASFASLWRSALAPVVAARPTWTLRDYHSPNLLWLPEREGVARLGVIDFQDCVMGHPAYDVASLLQDARVTVPPALELRLLGHYARQRRGGDPAFDLAEFAGAYALLGAQRATKIMGIFTRLKERDDKPQYLQHLPRIEAYLVRCLAHPVLADLRDWYAQHLPQLFEPSDEAREPST